MLRRLGYRVVRVPAAPVHADAALGAVALRSVQAAGRGYLVQSGNDSRFRAFSLLGPRVCFPHFHVLAIDAFDGAPQIVGVEIGVALRGREVGVPGELLHRDGRCPVPEQLGQRSAADRKMTSLRAWLAP